MNITRSASASLFALALVIFAAALSSPAHAESARTEHTRVTNPNAVGIEFFGRGMLYSFFFDRVASDDIVGGVGIGSVSLRDLTGNDVNKTTTLLPVYLNYYFAREANSFYATVGADIVFDPDAAKGNKSSVGGIQFSDNAMLPIAGVGFESRSDSGFLLRATGYAMYGKKLQPWLGLSFGMSF